MKRFIKSDYFLVTVSVLVSILLWVFVSYEVNPIHEIWIEDVPIAYTNQSSDFENGKLVILSGKENSADIKIRGRRGDISAVNDDDVTCSVSLAGINTGGTYTLPVSFESNMYGIELMQKTPHSVEIVVDRVTTREMEIEVVKTGEASQGYIAGDIECSPLKVKLTGAQSLVGNVKTARVNVDISNVQSDIYGLYKIKLYDENGNEINDERISTNIEYCDINCPVYQKKEINITPLLSGETNGFGQPVTVSSINPQTVFLIGKSDKLGEINEVYTNTINTSNVSGTTIINVKLDLYGIPEDVKIENDVTEVQIELYAQETQQNQDEQNQSGRQNEPEDNGGNE